MIYLFYGVFATLLVTAVVCQIGIYLTTRRLRNIELRIIDRYHSKIDKIPSILCVLLKHSKKLSEYHDLTELHRIAIISPTASIFDVLEINAHVSDRFIFLMRLALSIKSTTRDGNFITIRENITTIEGQIRELLIDYRGILTTHNAYIKAREYTVFGALLPGARRPMI